MPELGSGIEVARSFRTIVYADGRLAARDSEIINPLASLPIPHRQLSVLGKVPIHEGRCWSFHSREAMWRSTRAYFSRGAQINPRCCRSSSRKSIVSRTPRASTALDPLATPANRPTERCMGRPRRLHRPKAFTWRMTVPYIPRVMRYLDDDDGILAVERLAHVKAFQCWLIGLRFCVRLSLNQISSDLNVDNASSNDGPPKSFRTGRVP